MPSPEPPHATSAAGAGWRRLLPRGGRGGVALLAVLALLLAAAVVFSVNAEKPWGRTVQKRVAKQQALTPKEYAITGLWWGSVVNAGLLALLLATAGKWVPQHSGGGARASGILPVTRAGRMAALTFLLAAVALAAWLRAPRLHHSLWNDEEYAMRRFAHGAWEPQKDATWQFEPATWTETLFENRNGNNHVLNSLATRLALDTWRAATGAPRDAFSESALRAPGFIAGLLTVGVIFLIGSLTGGPLVGIGAAFLLALCPWHVRYAVEAKGYSLMLLFAGTAIYALIRALEENRLRWWLVFALSEAGLVLSFAGSIYLPVALNLFAAIELIKSKRAARLGTLVAFNLLAAIPVIQWMLPCVPQILNYLRSEGSIHLDLGWPWLRDFLSGLVIGFQFDNPGDHAGTSWLLETAAHPWLAPFAWLAAALFLTGVAFAFFQNAAARLAVVAPAFAVAAAYAHNFFSGTPMFVWYLIYAVVPVVLAIPLALARLGNFAQASFAGRAGNRGRGIPAAALLLAFLLAAAAATHGATERLRAHARQPMREAVAFVRAQDPAALTAVLGVSDKQITSYAPKASLLNDRPAFASWAAAARREGKSGFILVCGREAILQGADGKLRSKQPALAALDHGLRADESGGRAFTFREAAFFPGTEAMFSYRVYRMEP
jgi:hypothetical protein